MVSYACWGDDHEDLGDKVREAVERAQRRGDWNFGMEDDDRPTVEIEVYCSIGHRNIISY